MRIVSEIALIYCAVSSLVQSSVKLYLSSSRTVDALRSTWRCGRVEIKDEKFYLREEREEAPGYTLCSDASSRSSRGIASRRRQFSLFLASIHVRTCARGDETSSQRAMPATVPTLGATSVMLNAPRLPVIIVTASVVGLCRITYERMNERTNEHTSLPPQAQKTPTSEPLITTQTSSPRNARRKRQGDLARARAPARKREREERNSRVADTAHDLLPPLSGRTCLREIVGPISATAFHAKRTRASTTSRYRKSTPRPSLAHRPAGRSAYIGASPRALRRRGLSYYRKQPRARRLSPRKRAAVCGSPWLRVHRAVPDGFHEPSKTAPARIITKCPAIMAGRRSSASSGYHDSTYTQQR